MKLLDRIALHRLFMLVTTFVLAVLKLVIPQPNGDEPEEDKRVPWLRRRRKK